MPGTKTARKKNTPTPSRGTRPTTAQKRPTVATGLLQVSAQGAIYKGDDRLMVAVRVLDEAGKPVTGLTEQNFHLWQLGHFFSGVSDFFVVELGDIDDLKGLYQLVRSPWSLVGTGTIPFYVRVKKGVRTGGALTFIVKVREGLDTE
jgi:hypothetical protein